MGYLSNGEVVVVGASQLTGAFVGSSAKATNELLDSVAGKVLVIDEAYVLGTTSFGKEALDVLVERVQGTPGEDFAVILCGYNDPMRKMLKDCNPGLARRFKIDDAFLFEDYSDAELEKILQQMASEAGMLVSPEIAQSVVKKVIAKQRIKPNFGNAGAVANLLDRGKQRLMGRGDRQKRDNQWVILEEDFDGDEVVVEASEMAERSFLPQVSLDLERLLATGTDDNIVVNYGLPTVAIKRSRDDLASSAIVPNKKDVLPSPRVADAFADDVNVDTTKSMVRIYPELVKPQLECLLLVTAVASQNQTDVCGADRTLTDESRSAEDQRPATKLHDTLSAEDIPPTATANGGPEDISVWAALEEACSDLGYTLLELVSFLRTADYPAVLLMLIKKKVRGQDTTHVRQMLEPQRVEMLARVDEALRIVEAERLRRIEEDRKVRDEEARKALFLARAKEERSQERLRRLGKCPMQFEWIRHGGGYRCAGGSHYVTESELNWEELSENM